MTRLTRTRALSAALAGALLAGGAVPLAVAADGQQDAQPGNPQDERDGRRDERRQRRAAAAEAAASQPGQPEQVDSRFEPRTVQAEPAQRRERWEKSRERSDDGARREQAFREQAERSRLERDIQQARAEDVRRDELQRQQARRDVMRRDAEAEREAVVSSRMRERELRADEPGIADRGEFERPAVMRTPISTRGGIRPPGEIDDVRADAPRGGDARVPRDEQRRLIDQQRARAAAWQREDASRRYRIEARARELEQQRRMAHYRYQQDYYRRWMAQQARWSVSAHDWYNDPYYYTPANYRYGFGGGNYYTNRYGAELLRQAVRDGYQEGWYAGRADRMDGWRYDYRGSYGWMDGSYGYRGYYVSREAYRHYFRQGFERGYRDAYYGRYTYGRYDSRSNLASILPTVLSAILGFRTY